LLPIDGFFHAKIGRKFGELFQQRGGIFIVLEERPQASLLLRNARRPAFLKLFA
jgi:hypothetical protein